MNCLIRGFRMMSPSWLLLQRQDLAGLEIFEAVEVVRWDPLANVLVKLGPPTAAVSSEMKLSKEKALLIAAPGRLGGPIHYLSSVRLFRQQRLFP
jgi:hypothetical protein